VTIAAQTGRLTPLFNPRSHVWSSHFRWEGAVLVGTTAIGRTTVEVLAVNAPARIAVRATLIAVGKFPPAFR
jgi:hypothetical protein